jgi:hypothetical protein
MDILRHSSMPDPINLLQIRLAKGEITPGQYRAGLKMLHGT